MKNFEYVVGKVTKLDKKNFEFITPDNKKGIVFISEISDYYIDEIKSIIKISSFLTLEVIEIKNDLLHCSFKGIRPDYLKNPFKYKLQETNNKFQNLLNFTKKEIEKWKI